MVINESPIEGSKGRKDWIISRSTNVQARLKIQAIHPPNPYFLWGILRVRTEMFKRDWKFSIFGPLGEGSKSPISGKEGFGVKKLPFHSAPEMGALSQKKSPLSLWSPAEKWGFFDSKRPFLGQGEMGVFWPRNPLFPILAILTPVGGGARSQGTSAERNCPPKKIIIYTKKWFEKHEKGSEKWSETSHRVLNYLNPSRPA